MQKFVNEPIFNSNKILTINDDIPKCENIIIMSLTRNIFLIYKIQMFKLSEYLTIYL